MIKPYPTQIAAGRIRRARRRGPLVALIAGPYRAVLINIFGA